MKKMVIFLSLVIVISIVSGQEMPKDTLSKKEIKQKKKEEKEKKLQENYEKLFKIMNDKNFVQLIDCINASNNVSNWLNFVIVDSTSFTIQLSTSFGAGFNGIGGSTIKGKIITYKLAKNDKRKTCFLGLKVETMMQTLDITIDVTASGDGRTTIITYDGGSLVLEGKVMPMNEATIMMGTSF